MLWQVDKGGAVSAADAANVLKKSKLADPVLHKVCIVHSVYSQPMGFACFGT